MNTLVDDVFKEFLEDMEQEKSFCTYLRTWDYEDDYSHNEIEEAREELEEKIIEWLIENKPNKYYMLGGFEETFLLTKEEMIKRNRKLERYEIIKEGYGGIW